MQQSAQLRQTSKAAANNQGNNSFQAGTSVKKNGNLDTNGVRRQGNKRIVNNINNNNNNNNNKNNICNNRRGSKNFNFYEYTRHQQNKVETL